jgi:signal transduction histidine kinase
MSAFFELTPQWIRFEQFWITLKRRNVWLIQMRYGAVVMLASFILAFEFIPQLNINTLPLVIICCSILAYNALFHWLVHFIPEKQSNFHGLHFALIQILTDFSVLLLFVYYTGGIETPFHVFFLFHVIIGSLILPGRIVSLVILGTITISATGSLLELQGIIPHNRIDGLLPFSLYDNAAYLVLHFLVFSVALFTSNYLANSISNELYQRERALYRTYMQLQDAEKQKSKYVMSVVHDLKTPIAAAITYLNMILDGSIGKVDEPLQKPLQRSHFRLSGAIKMIGDVLELSQVKLSSEFNVETVMLKPLFNEIFQEMRVLFEAKDLTFSINTPSGSPEVCVDAEPRLLKLALANLVSNARKYTEEHGSVAVFLEEKDSVVTIEVADTGIGIPRKELGKVMNDFYRSTISKRKGIEGTGLGMSIVAHIVKEHQGAISVDSPSRIALSETCPGTSFVITLPLKYAPVSMMDT